MNSNSAPNPRVIPEAQAYSLEPEEVGSQLSSYIPGPPSPDPRDRTYDEYCAYCNKYPRAPITLKDDLVAVDTSESSTTCTTPVASPRAQLQEAAATNTGDAATTQPKEQFTCVRYTTPSLWV